MSFGCLILHNRIVHSTQQPAVTESAAAAARSRWRIDWNGFLSARLFGNSTKRSLARLALRCAECWLSLNRSSNPQSNIQILNTERKRARKLSSFSRNWDCYLTWPRCCDRKPIGTTSNRMRKSCDTLPIGNVSSVHLCVSSPLRWFGTHDDEFTASMTRRSLPFLLPLWCANISRRHVSFVMPNVGDINVRGWVVGNKRKCRKWPNITLWEHTNKEKTMQISIYEHYD